MSDRAVRSQDEARRTSWPLVLPVGWFVLVVIASGFILLVQMAVGLEAIPVQSGARLALVALALLALTARKSAAPPLPMHLRSSIRFFLISVLVALFATMIRSDEYGEPLASFMFIYGTGVFIGLALLVPITARFGILFKAFFLASLCFGLIQAMRQDLLLPPELLDRFGILFQEFVNGRVRIVSFFASPPRFAEFLVIGACFIQYQIMMRRGQRWALLPLYGAVVFAIFNTYSRSGYLLFLVSAVLLLFLLRRSVRGGRGFGPVGSFIILLVFGVVIGAISVGRLPLDSSVTDSTSLYARQGHWSSLVSQLEQSDFVSTLVGTGRSARFSPTDPQYFVVDNLALAVFMYAGLIGILGLAFLYVSMVRSMFALRAAGVSGLEPLMAFLAGLLVEGAFVDNHNTVFVALLASLGVLTQRAIQHCATDQALVPMPSAPGKLTEPSSQAG